MSIDTGWLHRFISCTPFGADAPSDDIIKAHSIVNALERELAEARAWREKGDRIALDAMAERDAARAEVEHLKSELQLVTAPHESVGAVMRAEVEAAARWFFEAGGDARAELFRRGGCETFGLAWSRYQQEREKRDE